jgi:hypothetical protein
MKKLYFKIFLLLLCYNQLTAQNNVGIGTSSPDASAKLDVNTAADPANGKKGLLIPSVTTTERDAIPSPAVGLQVFNSTVGTHQWWNGTCWLPIGSSTCSDFSLSAAPTSGCIIFNPNTTLTTTISVNLVSGSSIPVSMGVSHNMTGSGASAVLTNSVVNVGGSTTLTISPSNTPTGSYTVTITGIQGTVTKSVTYTVNIVGTHTTSLSSSSQNLTQLPNAAGGNSGVNTITTTLTLASSNTPCTSIGTSNTTSTVSFVGLPSTIAGAWNTTTPSVGGTATATFTVTACTPLGTYPITLRSIWNGQTVDKTYTITVVKAITTVGAGNNNNIFTLLGGATNCNCGSGTSQLRVNVSIGGDQAATTASAAPALQTGGFQSGAGVDITFNADAYGFGGQGGQGQGSGNCQAGFNGGDAFLINGNTGSTFTVNINGRKLYGGGGGGAGGRGNNDCCGCGAAGGGGGGGAGSNANGGNRSGGSGSSNGSPGSGGAGGGGGAGGSGYGGGIACNCARNGGAGGAYGCNGGTSTSCGGAGGTCSAGSAGAGIRKTGGTATYSGGTIDVSACGTGNVRGNNVP